MSDNSLKLTDGRRRRRRRRRQVVELLLLTSSSDTCVTSNAVDEDPLPLCRGGDLTMLSSPAVSQGKTL